MKQIGSAAIAALGLAFVVTAPATAAQKNGATATDFKLTNINGKTVQLSQYRGRTVVLEWHNPGCPYVGKHYNSGNMQATQKTATRNEVVWLTINSGAPGKQGHMTGKEAQKLYAAQGLNSSQYLLDTKGLVGKAYRAKTTPHMYIIDAKGILVYQGAIDSKPTANPADIKTARNHVLAALSELRDRKPVSVARSRPYGCSVKYAN